jgi:hypothetical protein
MAALAGKADREVFNFVTLYESVFPKKADNVKYVQECVLCLCKS